jgi:hypothetical protein
MKPNLFAAQEREARLTKLGLALQVLERHVDFAAMAASVDKAALRPGRERGGRPPFPREVIVRILLIQKLFNMSDEQMEFQLLDRLSFQRFAGLRDSSQIPDRTMIGTFKERLIKAGASESVFEAVNRQLARHGYIADGGQMIAEQHCRRRQCDAEGLVATKATPERPGRPLDEEARQILLRLQAVGERGQTLQADPQDQDQYRQRTRHAAL